MASKTTGADVRLWWFSIVVYYLLLFASSVNAARSTPGSDSQEMKLSTPLRLQITDKQVVMENGFITVTLSNPNGGIAGIQCQGISNVLEYGLKETNRGYWDIMWSMPGTSTSNFDTLPATQFSVITADQNQIEVSFTKTYNPNDSSSVPMNFDKRYVMLPGRSGFYTYAIYDHPEGWPDVDIGETRLAVKLQRKLFNYMAISDEIQRVMPSDQDRSTGDPLDYKEAVLLTKPSNPSLKGEVDDKYQYSLENKDIKVHGWVCPNPHVGFWIITGGDEFRSGGPIKQDLTSHVGPTALSVFFSGHYAGNDYSISLRNGEAWKKVFGPVFIYLNSDQGTDPKSLWENAKQQMVLETKSWPYDFPMSEDYPSATQRGTVSGQLLIRDRYLSQQLMPAKSAYVGLAPPGLAGSWQEDVKGYQFWTQTDDNGYFKISAVRPGNYSLYGWAPGILGDYKYNVDVNINPGDEINLGELVFDPPRNGPTLWEIGIPDRKAAEFFVPDPAPKLMNYALLNHTEKYRQYGLWDRYTAVYPHEDLSYRVGQSDYRKDWFFAHVNRKVGDTYEPTTWRILFPLENVNATGTYTLQIALASSNFAKIQVWINSDPGTRMPGFTTSGNGRDNAIARHGSHGLYSLSSFEFPGNMVVNGENTIYLRQPRGGYRFNGAMYDYIRLEGPSY
ncbi:rhamnogalacturonate lyase B-like [Ipomoea triloba]|uniref:rhamnogalacturonate lyase B-like n=1 Tax=Ipomoea triloba TaxID=35885 RepID=UPI00125E24C1|nr:rhamnogalacturonate lyase B-like [Ipomoea triloba]